MIIIIIIKTINRVVTKNSYLQPWASHVQVIRLNNKGKDKFLSKSHIFLNLWMVEVRQPTLYHIHYFMIQW